MTLYFTTAPGVPSSPCETRKGFIFSALAPMRLRGTEPSPAAMALACVCLSGYVYTDGYKFPLLLAFCILFFALLSPPLPLLPKRKQLLLHSVVRLFFLTKMR